MRITKDMCAVVSGRTHTNTKRLEFDIQTERKANHGKPTSNALKAELKKISRKLRKERKRVEYNAD